MVSETDKKGCLHTAWLVVRQHAIPLGGLQVTFSGDRTLYGSYGGVERKPTGMGIFTSFMCGNKAQQFSINAVGPVCTVLMIMHFKQELHWMLLRKRQV